jgi:hypothetical protein
VGSAKSKRRPRSPREKSKKGGIVAGCLWTHHRQNEILLMRTRFEERDQGTQAFRSSLLSRTARTLEKLSPAVVLERLDVPSLTRGRSASDLPGTVERRRPIFRRGPIRITYAPNIASDGHHVPASVGRSTAEFSARNRFPFDISPLDRDLPSPPVSIPGLLSPPLF